MQYYAKLITGETIDLCGRDHQTLCRMVARGVENGVTLQDGDVIKSAAVIYLGKQEDTGALTPLGQVSIKSGQVKEDPIVKIKTKVTKKDK